MVYVNTSRIAGFNLIERFAALRADIATRVSQSRAYRATFNELSAMTDRELADIGVARSMIHEISRQAAEQ